MCVEVPAACPESMAVSKAPDAKMPTVTGQNENAVAAYSRGRQNRIGLFRQHWRVVGGKENGGIIVRSGPEGAKSPYVGRLGTGAVVEETGNSLDRLEYKLLHGD